MYYVEFLRVRKALVWYSAVIAAIVLFVLLLALVAGNHFHMDGTANKNADIPLSALFGIAAYCATIFATIVSTSINKENDGVEIVWTKPFARERIALAYYAVDAAGILLAFTVAFVLLVGTPLAALGLLGYVHADALTVPVVVLGLGVAFMWYGVLQASTSGYGGRGGLFAGLSWLAAFVLVGLGTMSLPPIYHHVFIAINFLNPLAYFPSMSSVDTDTLNGKVHAGTILPLTLGMRMLFVWALAAIALALAAFNWKRMEI